MNSDMRRKYLCNSLNIAFSALRKQDPQDGQVFAMVMFSGRKSRCRAWIALRMSEALASAWWAGRRLSPTLLTPRMVAAVTTQSREDIY